MPIEIVEGAEAFANIVGDPANVFLYGPPGSGKTTDAALAFCRDGRCSAFFISCEDGGLKSIAARGLPPPGHTKRPVKTWQDMQDTIAFLGQNRGRYSAVIIDGATTFTNNLSREVEERHKGSKNKFAVWTEMRSYLFYLREWIRMLGLHAIFIGHGLSPEVRDGVFFPGGPALSPKTMIEVYYGLIDTVLRVGYLSIPGQAPLRVYYTGGTQWPAIPGVIAPPMDWQAWRQKNREGCNVAVVPADLGAFLRARQPPYAGL